MLGSIRDLTPILLVVVFFELAVLQQPIPNITQMLIGLVFVVAGLTFFIFGLEQGLFPIGESLAHDFARKGSLLWLFIFAFALGFGTTIAEPALIAVSGEASEIAAQGGVIANTEEAMARYANGLRLTVALAVGFARRAEDSEGLADPLADHRRVYRGRDHDLVRTAGDHRHRL
jgi:hypothetical protein